jgi:hypothetical protein
VVLGLTFAQLVSVALIAGGTAWLVQRRGSLVETRQAG